MINHRKSCIMADGLEHLRLQPSTTHTLNGFVRGADPTWLLRFDTKRLWLHSPQYTWLRTKDLAKTFLIQRPRYTNTKRRARDSYMTTSLDHPDLLLLRLIARTKLLITVWTRQDVAFFGRHCEAFRSGRKGSDGVFCRLLLLLIRLQRKGL